MSTFVISLGGSIVTPEAGKVDTAFLKRFRAIILKYIKKGHRFAIVVGGGKPCRIWQDAARKLGVKDVDDLDWIGIRATQANAEVVRTIFGRHAYKEVIADPHKKVGKFKILMGAGYKPRSSSDLDAVVRAKTLNARTVINLSNVPYVYDKDPRKHKNAKHFTNLTWKEFFNIVGRKYKPGMNTPFGIPAAKRAEKLKMKVVIMNGKDLKSLENLLKGKGFRGTIIE